MKILVTGASGQLGAYLLDALSSTQHAIVAWSGTQPAVRGSFELIPVDLTNLDAIEPALARTDPAVVIHAAAISSAEGVRLEPARANLVNVRATRRIAEWVESNNRRLVFTSTDLVFAGTRPWNREDDDAEPILAYGRSKRVAELELVLFQSAVVARLPLLYGPTRCGRPSFFDRVIAAIRAGDEQACFEDEFRTPLDYQTAARGLMLLATSGVTGLIHLAGTERMSRFDLITRAVRQMGLNPALVRANRQAEAALVEPRPADVSLATARWQGLFPTTTCPSVEEATARLVG